MRPTKNRKFCLGCQRPKMLFETKAKANNFIKFNSPEISANSHKVPKRSYYCPFCCGWHVTSVETERAQACEEHDKQMLDAIHAINHPKAPCDAQEKSIKIKHKNELNEICVRIDNTIAQIESALMQAETSKLCTKFEQLLELQNKLHTKSNEFDIHGETIDKRLEKIEKAKATFLFVYDYITDKDKRQEYLSRLSEEEKSERTNIMINNIDVIDQINERFDEIKASETQSGTREKIEGLCSEITTVLMPKLIGVTNKLKKYFTGKIESIRTSLHRAQENIDTFYEGLLQMTQKYIEQAREAINSNDIALCEQNLLRAENLLPDIFSEREQALYNQIAQLRALTVKSISGQAG